MMRADWKETFYDHPRPGDWLRCTLSQATHQYPHLMDLKGTSQNPIYHPEGNALVHTLCTIDSMTDILDREGIKGAERAMFLLVMVCHDLGKAWTTV